MEILIDGIREGGTIPDRYTCKGAGQSPEITWRNLPTGIKSLALVMDDPDAPRSTFTHWLVWDIPTTATRLAAGMARKSELANGLKQGVNSGGAYGYYPPCPPPGPSHRYIFRLMALDAEPALAPGASRGQFDQALKGHILAEASVTGMFGR